MYLECREHGIVPKYGIPEIIVRVCGFRFPEPFPGRFVHLRPYLAEQVDLNIRGRVEVLAVNVEEGTPEHFVGKFKASGDIAVLGPVEFIDYQSKAAPPSDGAFLKKPASQLRTGVFHTLPNPAQSAFVYLNWDKDSLHARIQTRTQAIFDPMCQETQALLNQGTPADVPALKSLGYPQAVAYLQGQLTRTQAVEQIALLTRQYAKRQRTWFNRYTQALVLGLQTPQDFDLKKISEQIICFTDK